MAPEAELANPEHVEVEATWGIYQRIVTAYREPDKNNTKHMMQGLIDAVGSGVPATLVEIRRLGRTLKQREEPVRHPEPRSSPTSPVPPESTAPHSSAERDRPTNPRNCGLVVSAHGCAEWRQDWRARSQDLLLVEKFKTSRQASSIGASVRFWRGVAARDDSGQGP